jgi:hypothetical protein
VQCGPHFWLGSSYRDAHIGFTLRSGLLRQADLSIPQESPRGIGHLGDSALASWPIFASARVQPARIQFLMLVSPCLARTIGQEMEPFKGLSTRQVVELELLAIFVQDRERGPAVGPR